jgi:peptide-methionine (S)-S-oxide reductase
VIRTRVGYTGDEKLDPTYHDLGGHTEALQLDFDPTVISYADLLEHFWSSHSPTSPAYSAQYKAAVFYHTEEQRALAHASMDKLAADAERIICTELLPASRFYRAEDYHQKYCLRRNAELTAKLEAIYPDPGDFTDSTAAARLNGQLAGFGALAIDLA